MTQRPTFHCQRQCWKQGIVGNAEFNSLQNKIFFVSIVPLMLKKSSFCNYVCSLLTLKKKKYTDSKRDKLQNQTLLRHSYSFYLTRIWMFFSSNANLLDHHRRMYVFLNTLFRNTVNATSASTENLSAANKLQRTPSLPRSYSRNRSGIPVAYRDQPQSTIRGYFAKMLCFLLFLCFMFYEQ